MRNLAYRDLMDTCQEMMAESALEISEAISNTAGFDSFDEVP